jgi:hypothetical protein
VHAVIVNKKEVVMPRQQQQEKRPILVDAIKRITDMAILVMINGKDHWIPKSQVWEPDELDLTDEPTEIHVTPWFIKKEGLDNEQ